MPNLVPRPHVGTDAAREKYTVPIGTEPGGLTDWTARAGRGSGSLLLLVLLAAGAWYAWKKWG